jgi:alkylhydroperoxidase family enzyme
VTLDVGYVDALRADWRTAPLPDADLAMLGYVEKLTLAPGSLTQDDLAPLRAAGFDDIAITQIAGIASMLCYLNRMADGLGTGRG